MVAHERGPKPQIFRENRGEIGPGESGLFGADWDQFLPIPQPQGKSRNYPQRAVFGPIGAFRAEARVCKAPV